MRKRTWLAAAGGSLLAATLGLFGAAASASASTTSPVTGYTYVNGNTATANTIAGYARHADGSLTPLAGSPFTISGAGLGRGPGSQGAIQATRTAGTCWPSTPAVTRSRSCASPPRRARPGRQAGLLRGIKPASVAVSPFGVVYVANQGNAAGGAGFSGFASASAAR